MWTPKRLLLAIAGFALLFGDWLKANPEVRDEYLAVKRRAEQAADGDIERYLAVKEPWFAEAYRLAWDWADRSDWRPARP